MKEERAQLIRAESKTSREFYVKNNKNLMKQKTNSSEGTVTLETYKQL